MIKYDSSDLFKYYVMSKHKPIQSRENQLVMDATAIELISIQYDGFVDKQF